MAITSYGSILENSCSTSSKKNVVVLSANSTTAHTGTDTAKKEMTATPTTTVSVGSTITNTRVLAAAFLSSLATGGPTYAFGLYGATLKRNLHLSQSQLDTVAAANFAAGFVSWIPGMIVDHWGPRLSMTVGGCCQCCLLSLYWLVARQIIPLHHHHAWVVPILSTIGFFIFMSNALVVASLFKSLVLTCTHKTKGSAVGAAKAFVGLGAGVYSCMFDSLMRSSSHSHYVSSDLDFLLLASVFAIFCIALPGWNLIPARSVLRQVVDVSDGRYYQVIYMGLLVLGVTVLGSSAMVMFRPIVTTHDDEVVDAPSPLHKPHVQRAILLLLAWFGPIAAMFFLECKPASSSSSKSSSSSPCSPLIIDEPTAISFQMDNTHAVEDDEEQQQAHLIKEEDRSITNDNKETTEELLDENIISSSNNECHEDDDDSSSAYTYDPPRITAQSRSLSMLVVDVSLTQMLTTKPSAWLFLFTATMIVGSGTMMTNNMGQMVESLGDALPRGATAACLAIFSVSQAAARALTGCLSDWALLSSDSRYRIPRTVFVVLSAFLGMLGHAVLAFGGKDDPDGSSTRSTFVAGVILVGVSFGMIWPLQVLIVGDLFGKRYHGANYMFYDGFTSAVGTLLVAKHIAQTVYERHIEDENEINCYGESCFASAHGIVAIFCALACGSAMTLLLLTRHSYRLQ